MDDVEQVTEIQNAALNNVASQKYIFGINLRTLTSKNSYSKNILYYTQSKTDYEYGIAFPQIDANGNLINTNTITFENKVRTVNRSESKIGYRSIIQST